MALKPYTSPAITAGLLKFVGGLNSTAGPLELSNQESSDLQNVDFDKFGSIAKRNGYLNANTTPIASGAQISGLVDYELSGGTRYTLVIAGATVQYYDSSSITGDPTDITGSLTITPDNLVSSAVLRETALMTNGEDLPFQWNANGGQVTAITISNGGSGYIDQDIITIDSGDVNCTFRATVSSGIVVSVTLMGAGSGYSTGTNIPTVGGNGLGCTMNITTVSNNAVPMGVPTDLQKAKYVTIYQNYAFLANVTVDSVNYRSRLYWSGINNIGSWDAADFNDVSRDDGQKITGIKRLGDRLVIFKDRSIHVAFFTGDADIPFQFTQTNSPVGCVSNFSIQEVNNGLVFLSWDGLYFFDGFNAYKISDRLNKTFLTDLADKQFYKAVSCYQHSKNRYYLAIASSGQTDNDTIITWTRSETTLVTDAFGVYKGHNACCMAIVFTDGVTELPYFGDYDGYVYRMDYGLDDCPLGVQTAIDAYYYTNWLAYDDLCDQKETLSIYIYYQINSANITLVYSYDFNQGDQFSRLFSTSGGGSLWGAPAWGGFTWGIGGGGIQRIDVDGRGRTVRFGIKNSTLSETFRVDGIGTLTYLGTHV